MAQGRRMQWRLRQARWWPLWVLALILAGAGWAQAMGTRAQPDDAPGGGAAGQPLPAAGGAPALARPGEVLIRFRADVGAERRTAVLDELGLRAVRAVGDAQGVLAALPPGLSVEAALERLRARPEVATADPNYVTPRAPMPGRASPSPYSPR